MYLHVCFYVLWLNGSIDFNLSYVIRFILMSWCYWIQGRVILFNKPSNRVVNKIYTKYEFMFWGRKCIPSIWFLHQSCFFMIKWFLQIVYLAICHFSCVITFMRIFNLVICIRVRAHWFIELSFFRNRPMIKWSLKGVDFKNHEISHCSVYWG